MTIQGKIVDIPNKKIFKGEIIIENNKIVNIREVNHTIETYILPGFIDAHIHIESSMLVPSEFAKIALTHGTVATVSDPHEIANVPYCVRSCTTTAYCSNRKLPQYYIDATYIIQRLLYHACSYIG